MRTSLLTGMAALLGAASALSLLASAPAYAGGLGVLVNGGVHTEHAYYYDLNDQQGIDLQARPNGAIGLEALLGDRDDRVQGVLRIYYLGDAPLAKPDTGDLSADEVVYPPDSEQGWSKKGVMEAGVQWGLLGDPGKVNFTAITALGSGFATGDNLEFLILDVGPGMTLSLTDSLQFTANAEFNVRYRKTLSYGGGVVAGLRFMFD